MYAKFAAAIICIALCSLNVVAAVKRTPIRTTLTGSTRTTIEMMPSPNSSVHWMSAIIFIAGFASFLGWGISDYNNAIEGDEIIDDSVSTNAPTSSNNIQLTPPTNSNVNDVSTNNLIKFPSRSLSNNTDLDVANQSETLSPQEFYSQLQQEDIWSDDNSNPNNTAN
ncbi:MAG: hypothetical protein AAFR83_24455 [Cyanobacteria bacterium J06629_18]